MKKNGLLKRAIFEAGTTQSKVAQEAEIPKSYMSMVVNGKMLLDESQKQRLSRILGKSPSDLGLEGAEQ